MIENSKVFIDPACNVYYSSYYIEGLNRVYGKENVSFSAKYFKDLKLRQETSSFDHYMAFVVVIRDYHPLRVIIDFRDKATVKENAFEWSDIYAKINFNLSKTDKKYHEKITSIPPAFGIKIWNIWETAYFCIVNYIRSRPVVSLKSYLTNYGAQYNRPYLSDFLKHESDEGPEDTRPYVFFNSRLWAHSVEETNSQRQDFVKLCKKLNCIFEGGFFASLNHPDYQQFQDLITFKRDTQTYIRKTKLSTIVFNTPAVHNCHGWKLSEYLAMGKAIISTPLLNELPENLIHGKDIHIISNYNELKEAINLLFTDSSYRRQLENSAWDYYLKYASPQSVIKNIINSHRSFRKMETLDHVALKPDLPRASVS